MIVIYTRQVRRRVGGSWQFASSEQINSYPIGCKNRKLLSGRGGEGITMTPMPNPENFLPSEKWQKNMH